MNTDICQVVFRTTRLEKNRTYAEQGGKDCLKQKAPSLAAFLPGQEERGTAQLDAALFRLHGKRLFCIQYKLVPQNQSHLSRDVGKYFPTGQAFVVGLETLNLIIMPDEKVSLGFQGSTWRMLARFAGRVRQGGSVCPGLPRPHCSDHKAQGRQQTMCIRVQRSVRPHAHALETRGPHPLSGAQTSPISWQEYCAIAGMRVGQAGDNAAVESSKATPRSQPSRTWNRLT